MCFTGNDDAVLPRIRSSRQRGCRCSASANRAAEVRKRGVVTTLSQLSTSVSRATCSESGCRGHMGFFHVTRYLHHGQSQLSSETLFVTGGRSRVSRESKRFGLSRPRRTRILSRAPSTQIRCIGATVSRETLAEHREDVPAAGRIAQICHGPAMMHCAAHDHPLICSTAARSAQRRYGSPANVPPHQTSGS